jgi:hypothetical protein
MNKETSVTLIVDGIRKLTELKSERLITNEEFDVIGGEMYMPKSLVLILLLFILLISGCSAYDPSIHDETIESFESKYNSYLNENVENPVEISKMDIEKEYSTYGKINDYRVRVYLKENKYDRNELWNLIESMAIELGDKEVIGEGTSSEGIYRYVTVIIGEGDWTMNIEGERKLDNKTYRKFMIDYYEDGNPVFYEGYRGE